jgi:hypothetical protein
VNAQEKADTLRNEIQAKFWKAMGLKPATITPPITIDSLDDMMTNRITQTMESLKRFVADGVLEKAQVVMKPVLSARHEISNAPSSELRSFAYDGNKKIGLASVAGPDTIAHEYGHTIEASNLRIQAAAIGFVEQRTAGEEPVNLSQKFPGRSYDEHETGKKDQFDRVFSERSAYYVGKTYGVGSTRDTEIISMGIEQLYKDPIKFAENDPEYFHLMVGALQGMI